MGWLNRPAAVGPTTQRGGRRHAGPTCHPADTPRGPAHISRLVHQGPLFASSACDYRLRHTLYRVFADLTLAYLHHQSVDEVP